MATKKYKGQSIRTDWKGNKYVILKGQFVKLTKTGKPRFWNKTEMKQLKNWGEKFIVINV
tara:strand:+ start:1000 stop:1179 length:180 start_codon:yes stop_codon:yes gene_type:complete